MSHRPVPVDLDPFDHWHGDPAELVEAMHLVPGVLLARIARSRPRWMLRAACRGHDINAFYPSRGESTTEAKTTCDGCPVTDDCAAHALDHHEHGVWGGLSGRQRRQLRAHRQRGAA